jgi:hypothetical protein
MHAQVSLHPSSFYVSDCTWCACYTVFALYDVVKIAFIFLEASTATNKAN